jgi:RiboL-PSP-HEPN
MRLARIDHAIAVCQTHLQNSGAAGTEIEAYLTRYLLVMICSTFEEEIKTLIMMRATGSSDPSMEPFVQNALGRTSFRSLMTSEIGDFLNRFGLDYKNRFRQQLASNQRAETFFNNIVTNRHDTAHSAGSNISFSELVRFYSEGHIVLDAVKVALQI